MAKKIITDNVRPPISIRNFDWVAFYDGEEESQHYGYGPTEQEAIADLKRLDQELWEASLEDGENWAAETD